ncbi:MAG: YqaE/Pmp3 family membrane protein [Bacteroidia bacterium]|nr:YqaE/Pmp3 family membrane protein [Bacteroidia bacterium]MDW8134696.1 YqaE/Pmp3 family membrane protein [Bacteroidia bacterium]
MRYALFTLGMLAFGVSGAVVTVAYGTPAYEVAATTAEKSTAPTKLKKEGFFHKALHFFANLWEKATTRIAPFSLWVLAILTPPLAVGIASNWDPDKVLIAMLLTALCTIPGIIYALIQVGRS